MQVPNRLFVIVDSGTISETRDKQEEKRPRKRQRIDSDEEDATPAAAQRTTPSSSPARPRRAVRTTAGRNPAVGKESVKEKKVEVEEESIPASTSKYTRDPDFFYADAEDANIYVGIENTVFKIHRHVLDSCEVMVEILKYASNWRTSEESPLVLDKPTVEEYKAFLWLNYASVDELNAPPHENEFLSRLHLIVSLTQKYRIPKLAAWMSTAVTHLTTDAVFLSSCSSSVLTRIATACVSYKLTTPLAVLTRTWLKRLEKADAPSAPAILAADELNLKELTGMAYYVHVQDMVERRGTTQTGAMQLRADPKLNNGQVMRLLTGYMSLVGFWEKVRMTPLVLPVPGGAKSVLGEGATPTSTSTTIQPPTCPGGDVHQKRCVATWDRRWISAAGWKRILGINNSDALALLACLRDQLMNDEELKAGMDAECRMNGLEGIKAMRERVREDLGDHFFGIV